MKKITPSKARLDLFDGEGAAAGSTSAAQADGGESRAATLPTPGQKDAGGKRGRGAGGYNSRPGAKAPGEETGGEEAMQQRRRAFREMVTGDFKDVYTEETQRLINHRFKETQALKEQLESQKPLLALLESKYAIPAGDVDRLTRAIREETERAKVSREGQRQQEQLRQQQWVKGQARQWMDQCMALGNKYPGFDLGREMARPQFAAMLRGGASVEQAYRTLHFDELVSGAVRRAAAGAEKRLADHIRARGSRPAENGIAAQSGFITKDDPSQLKRKDFEEIAKRAARGETIRF